MSTKITFKSLLPHLIGVISFILFESVVLFFYESQASFWEFAAFYSVNLIFFYISAYFVIGSVQRVPLKIDLHFVMLSILWIGITIFLDAMLTRALYGNRGMTLRLEDLKIPVAKAFFRYCYFYLLAYGLWSARSLVRREKENKEKDIKLLKSSNEKSELEIALLRSQTTPHLLLNTLNGVHNLVMSSNPRAAVLVELLMDNLRLSLKGSIVENNTILGEEIQLVKNIVHLYEQLGRNNCRLSIDVPKESLDKSFPVNLISTLVENVYKHADLNDPDHPATIDINQHGRQLTVSINNRYRMAKSDYSNGIGLENVKKRLEIQFKGRYEFISERTDDTFHTTLKILI